MLNWQRNKQTLLKPVDAFQWPWDSWNTGACSVLYATQGKSGNLIRLPQKSGNFWEFDKSVTLLENRVCAPTLSHSFITLYSDQLEWKPEWTQAFKNEEGRNIIPWEPCS